MAAWGTRENPQKYYSKKKFLRQPTTGRGINKEKILEILKILAELKTATHLQTFSFILKKEWIQPLNPNNPLHQRTLENPITPTENDPWGILKERSPVSHRKFLIKKLFYNIYNLIFRTFKRRGRVVHIKQENYISMMGMNIQDKEAEDQVSSSMLTISELGVDLHPPINLPPCYNHIDIALLETK